MRRMAVMACLLMALAACAGGKKEPDQGPATLPADFNAATATPEYVAALPRNQAKPAIKAMVDAFTLEANSQCAMQAIGYDCLNRRYETAFDPQLVYAQKCQVHGSGEAYRLCLMVGAETVPLMVAAGDDPRLDIDWTKLGEMNNAGRRALLNKVLPRCGEDKDCIAGAMAERIGLSRFVREACQEHELLLDRLNCISESLSALVYRRALDSLASAS